MTEINKFGNFRQTLKPLWGEPLADLIRKITGRDLPTFALMGLSEATVISIVDGYYCYKFQMSYLSESDIFRRIIKARMYNSETEQKFIKKEPRTLIEFIENILEAEGQNNELSQESIEKLIVKYCEAREITQITKKEIKIRCPNCGYEGKPVSGRSGILEILLFIFTLQFFLIPFFLYEHFTTKWKCPKCGFRNVIEFGKIEDEGTLGFGKGFKGFLSKTLFFFSLFCIIIAISHFIIGKWELGGLTLAIAFIMAYIAYSLAGNILNPMLIRDYWENKDLYECLSYVAIARKAQIGFSIYRDQEPYLNKLESIGIKKKPTEDIRQFIRDKVVRDRKAFDILRDNIIIKTFYKHKVWYWDGYGKIISRDSLYFYYEDAISFAINPDVISIFTKNLEGIENENLEKAKS